eukprot:scaffold35969_cov191-Amphora_coffeaeformis.AAC.1
MPLRFYGFLAMRFDSDFPSTGKIVFVDFPLNEASAAVAASWLAIHVVPIAPAPDAEVAAWVPVAVVLAVPVTVVEVAVVLAIPVAVVEVAAEVPVPVVLGNYASASLLVEKLTYLDNCVDGKCNTFPNPHQDSQASLLANDSNLAELGGAAPRVDCAVRRHFRFS